MRNQVLRIHDSDNVAVLLNDAAKGEMIEFDGSLLKAGENIGRGHKIALTDIAPGRQVIKYGFPIGSATELIHAGDWVHTHNIKTNLGGLSEYTYNPVLKPRERTAASEFSGYIRKNGRVGVRNEIWIINTVGCINKTAELLAQKANSRFAGRTDGVFTFAHPYGCSQLGEDQMNTQRILAGLVNHPNAAGVLVLGLGCENNNITEFKKVLGPYDPDRVRFLNAQDVGDEIKEGLKLLEELVRYAETFQREKCPVSGLVIGLKCGGSDAFSGITANPLVGAFSDRLTAQGGTTILTEVPEMFGAETLLMNRCISEEVFQKTVELINSFKDYYLRHGQAIYENPSPGNKEGGISTLEEKSLGCTQKGGTGCVTDVLHYGEAVKIRGLNLLEGPGNDMVASTALMSAGAQIILFTTGRGTPFGSCVPTVKISSGSGLFHSKKNWIDYDAGQLLEEKDAARAKSDFFDFVLRVASGEIKTKNEIDGLREIAIFKDGVTL